MEAHPYIIWCTLVTCFTQSTVCKNRSPVSFKMSASMRSHIFRRSFISRPFPSACSQILIKKADCSKIQLKQRCRGNDSTPQPTIFPTRSVATQVLAFTKGWGYTHDRRADKYPYPHDRRADKDSYPHDRNVTDDLCSLINLCFAFIMVNFFDLMCYSCWKVFTLKSAWIIKMIMHNRHRPKREKRDWSQHRW